MEILAWIGLSQSLFEGILIRTKKQVSISDKILSVWLFLLAVSFLINGLEYEIYKQPLITNSFLIINPAFYLYIKSLTRPDFKLKFSQLLHLIPFILFQVAIFIMGIPLAKSSIDFISDKQIFSSFYVGISILSWIIYNGLSIHMVHRHRKYLANEFSNIEANAKIGWILFLVILYVSFCAFILGFGIFVYVSIYKMQLIQNLTYSFFLILVYALGYYGLKQDIIFSEKVLIPKIKYEKSLLTNEKKLQIKNAILDHFEKEKPFLDPDFNMNSLSSNLNFPKYQITEVLSTVLHKNFFQFVNSYRIIEVKKQLADANSPFSIEAIGYECGFNSKSSFYTIFKKTTGKTPAQYRNSLS